MFAVRLTTQLYTEEFITQRKIETSLQCCWVLGQLPNNVTSDHNTSMFNFHKMFSNSVKCSAVTGLAVPGLPNSSKRVKTQLNVYSLILLTPVFALLSLEFYLLLWKWDSVRDLPLSMVVSIVMWYSTRCV